MSRFERFIAKPVENGVLEISRRIKSGQHPVFGFANKLAIILKEIDQPVLTNKNDVRINLVSRYDNVDVLNHPSTAGLGHVAVSRSLAVNRIGNCDKYATVSLKEPILVDKDNGWQAVEQPVDTSDYSFGVERKVLTDRIDTVFPELGRLWRPEEPALLLAEFKVDDPERANAILKFVVEEVAKENIQQTEVFDAFIRYRPAAL